MSPLDQNNVVDPTSVSPKATIIRYGLIGGLVLVVYSLIGNLLELSSPSSSGALKALNFFLLLAIYVVLMTLATKKHRDEELGGYITLGRGFMVAFGAGLIAAIISTIFNFIYITVIDPEFINNIIEQTVQGLEDQGMPEEQIDATLKITKAMLSPVGQLGLFAVMSLIGAIPAVIIALILKKEAPVIIDEE